MADTCSAFPATELKGKELALWLHIFGAVLLRG